MSNFFLKFQSLKNEKGGRKCGKSTKYCVDKAQFTMEIGVSEQIYRVQMG